MNSVELEWWWFVSPLVIAYACIGLHYLATAARQRRRPQPRPPEAVPPARAVIPQQRRRGAPPT